jgi:uncharacterized membrane protein
MSLLYNNIDVEIFLKNFEYIGVNTFLAVIPVVFGWLMIKFRSGILRFICGFLWFIFLPNTIYILTDITHLFEIWPNVDNFSRLALIFQYLIFSIAGIVTFAISIYFFQKLLEGKREKGISPLTIFAICMLNFIVGFGVILGGIRRTNSWYIFTNPSRVLEDALNLIYSQELLILVFGVGVLANLIYFIMAETVATWGKKYFKK